MTSRFEDIRRIFLPTDGSDYSMRAADYAISVAKMLGAEITTVFVIDAVVVDQYAKLAGREKAEKELQADGERYLKYIANLAQKQGVIAQSIFAKGRPYEEIVRLAKELKVDLIVMGTYGRRGAERILIGSVAERVIEYAHCPVLVVK